MAVEVVPVTRSQEVDEALHAPALAAPAQEDHQEGAAPAMRAQIIGGGLTESAPRIPATEIGRVRTFLRTNLERGSPAEAPNRVARPGRRTAGRAKKALAGPVGAVEGGPRPTPDLTSGST